MTLGTAIQVSDGKIQISSYTGFYEFRVEHVMIDKIKHLLIINKRQKCFMAQVLSDFAGVYQSKDVVKT